MKTSDPKRSQWGDVLDRAGNAGRAWRKSLVLRLAERIPAAEALAADPAALKRAIKAQRLARAMGHWCYRPETLRNMLAAYLRARAVRRPGNG